MIRFNVYNKLTGYRTPNPGKCKDQAELDSLKKDIETRNVPGQLEIIIEQLNK